VDVDLEHIGAADHNERVAQVPQVRPDLIGGRAALRLGPGPPCRTGTPRFRPGYSILPAAGPTSLEVRRRRQGPERFAVHVRADALQECTKPRRPRPRRRPAAARAAVGRAPARVTGPFSSSSTRSAKSRVRASRASSATSRMMRDDGAFDGALERAVDVLRRRAECSRRTRAPIAGVVGHGVREAEQEVGQDHAAVAAGAQDGRLRRGPRHQAEPRRRAGCAGYPQWRSPSAPGWCRYRRPARGTR
jgi:hypothetical protein